MRTLLCLLLMTITPTAVATAQEAFVAPSTNPLRAGAVSSGPAGLPTPGSPSLVQPYPSRQATFQTATAKPLLTETEKSDEATSGEPAEVEAAEAPTRQSIPSYGQRSAEAKRAGLAMADTPQSPTPSTSKTKAPEGRKLGAAAQQTSTGPLDFGENPFRQALQWRPQTETLTTVGSGLAMVLGLLLMTTWAIRKSMPRSARVLPDEIAEVLGRVNLGRKQTVQLLKIGRKLVLVSSTPEGEAKTLTEIDREEDVLHLLQLCQENSGRGAGAAFDEIFSDLSNQRAPEGFLGDEAERFDPHRLAAAYANTPGGQGRG